MEKSIMAVDDDAIILESLRVAFERAGYTVHCATSAEKALEILKKENIHVFFLDLQLPGMSGMELCKLIKKARPATCIYALTAYASLYDLVECREVGFDDYFSKPFDIRVLLETAASSFAKIERWSQELKRRGKKAREGGTEPEATKGPPA